MVVQQRLSVAELENAQETLLIPLWARAEELKRPSPILEDQVAAEICARLNFDFERFEQLGVDCTKCCSRAKIFDQLVVKSLQRTPSLTVVEIGAGLDTRFDRLAPDDVKWFELDFPEVVRIRRRFFDEGVQRRAIASSVLEKDWIDIVKQTNPKEVLFVAEGVFYFFDEQDLRSLFARLASHFPGSSIVFDSQTESLLRYTNWRHPLSGSKLTWGINDIRQVETWDPSLQVEESIGFGDSPYYDDHLHRWPMAMRLARRMWPWVRSMYRINQVRFTPKQTLIQEDDGSSFSDN